MTAATKTRSTDAAKAERAERFAALTAMVESFDFDELSDRAQRQYDEFLKHYSERNTVLILSQRPSATRLRMFNGWKQEGRKVKKGSKAIWILAPAGQTDRNAVSEPVESEAPVTDGQGNQVRRFFKMIALFDISQTEEDTN